MHLFFLYLILTMEHFFHFQSPLEWLKVSTLAEELCAIEFIDSKNTPKQLLLPQNQFQTTVEKQLSEYFEGTRTEFSLPLRLDGTGFQKQIWEYLLDIPFGKTLTYMDLAKQYGDIKAIRAVGMANNKNPLPVVVPCHRVIGSDGSLVGYAGGLAIKEWLLRHEGVITQLEIF
jgi:methylated-DNA-[protein]-cysteine S-methyltransferase